MITVIDFYSEVSGALLDAETSAGSAAGSSAKRNKQGCGLSKRPRVDDLFALDDLLSDDDLHEDEGRSSDRSSMVATEVRKYRNGANEGSGDVDALTFWAANRA